MAECVTCGNEYDPDRPDVVFSLRRAAKLDLDLEGRCVYCIVEGRIAMELFRRTLDLCHRCGEKPCRAGCLGD